ncbi:hypothetical protein [Nostoc favosum]|uniref:Uncharacterized protein n=1 Tax=Nostoc favosum CHAB5714 TaxID=2780399 RepID=A0ABS8IKV4_9NOSO|nr:hypothetical protein [Nostoc favosum]MCC5604102.1 hypothetical protein [Nostoc favosum CHAB5714]
MAEIGYIQQQYAWVKAKTSKVKFFNVDAASACRRLPQRRREASAPLRFPDLKQLARH